MYTWCHQEGRKLKFWYVPTADYLDQMTTGFEFFKELLKPENFPKGQWDVPEICILLNYQYIF